MIVILYHLRYLIKVNCYVNKIKSYIIKRFPSTMVNRLRSMKIIKEFMYSYLYLLGFKKYYPIYLKVKASENKFVKSNLDSLENRWGSAFHEYNSTSKKFVVDLVWSEGPIPGNFGDWLSPYIISKICDLDIRHLNEVGFKRKPHILALGSIISCANEQSVILGSGVTNKKIKINPDSKFISVRGKYTANLILQQSNRVVENFGDIGFLLKRVYNSKAISGYKNKYLLVRHIQHQNVVIQKCDLINEYSIYAAHPLDMELFIDELHSYEKVITSAMHCFIACLSYGIPCALVSFDNKTNSVPGDGIKYLDSLSGVNLIENPPLRISSDVDIDLLSYIDNMIFDHGFISTEKLDEIENSIFSAVDIAKYSREI